MGQFKELIFSKIALCTNKIGVIETVPFNPTALVVLNRNFKNEEHELRNI